MPPTPRQAKLLRAGRFSDLDLAHLVLEVEDLGETVYRSVRSRVRTVIEHLLSSSIPGKRAEKRLAGDDPHPTRQPRRGPHGGAPPAHRSRLTTVLRQGPARCRLGLRDYSQPAAADALPRTCLYTLDQIINDRLP